MHISADPLSGRACWRTSGLSVSTLQLWFLQFWFFATLQLWFQASMFVIFFKGDTKSWFFDDLLHLPLTYNGKTKMTSFVCLPLKSNGKNSGWYILPFEFLPLTFNGKHLFWRFSVLSICHWLSMATTYTRKPPK